MLDTYRDVEKQSWLLQNLPVPLDLPEETLARDQDMDRFYLPNPQVIVQERSREAEVYTKLWEAAKSGLPPYSTGHAWLTKGTTSAVVSGSMTHAVADTSVDITAYIIDAATNWISTLEPGLIDPPVQFISHRNGLSHELLCFCSRQEILHVLPLALDLVEKFLSGYQELDIQQEQDPETGESWLAIEITIEGDVDHVLDGYDRYMNEWVSRVPYPERDKVCLVYNII